MSTMGDLENLSTQLYSTTNKRDVLNKLHEKILNNLDSLTSEKVIFVTKSLCKNAKFCEPKFIEEQNKSFDESLLKKVLDILSDILFKSNKVIVNDMLSDNECFIDVFMFCICYKSSHIDFNWLKTTTLQQWENLNNIRLICEAKVLFNGYLKENFALRLFEIIKIYLKRFVVDTSNKLLIVFNIYLLQ